ncbi:MAG: ribosome maturation factor RimP [Ruminococcaceae bacterium]|nr:ribosome maturation factor RimP [Oscillospiraceae bacterium]
MASGKNVATVVTELVTPTVEELGYMLWDVEFVREAAEWFLRITIDNEEGITIEDCETVHRAIDPMLDDADPIEISYRLEVSSPGLEREIRTDMHFAACIGEKIVVKLFTKLDGKKEYIGILKSYENKTIVLDTDEGEKSIERKLASKVRTVFDF